MKPLYTEIEFQKAKYTDRLPFECRNCHKTFLRTKRRIVIGKIEGLSGDFCSTKCCNKFHCNPPVSVICDQCGKSFKKLPTQIKNTKHNFCCQSCSAIYTNTHKTKGTRVSKLEVWLAKQLIPLYPNIEFHFNRKDAINSELDIYIPSLKLAFELNGIFHYEPIFGEDKLASIQNNDSRKSQACIENGIELCLIDVSSLQYFKENKAIRFLTIVKDIINYKLSSLGLISTVSQQY